MARAGTIVRVAALCPGRVVQASCTFLKAKFLLNLIGRHFVSDALIGHHFISDALIGRPFTTLWVLDCWVVVSVVADLDPATSHS